MSAQINRDVCGGWRDVAPGRESLLMNIYVGNLPWSMTDQDLRGLFEAHGRVDSAKVISDRDTGQSRGFGFVEMPENDEANAAIEALNNYESDGRRLTVNEARPRREGPPRRSW